MPVDTLFSLDGFLVPEEMPLDENTWVELKMPRNLRFSHLSAFYVPRQTAQAGWAEKLEAVGIAPFQTYEPKIASLILEISSEELEEAKKRKRAYLETFRPKITNITIDAVIANYNAETYLAEAKETLLHRLEGKLKIKMDGQRFSQANPFEISEELNLSSFEKRLLFWRPRYGLVRETFNTLKDYEIIKEFLFWIEESPHLAISLGSQPNTPKPLWGFRRPNWILMEENKPIEKEPVDITSEIRTVSIRGDWPYDILDSRSRAYKSMQKSGLNPGEYVAKVNDLVQSLEERISFGN